MIGFQKPTRKGWLPYIKIGILYFLCFSVLPLGAATDPTDQLAQRMIELRKEVEVENEKYEVNKSQLFDRLKALSAERMELESNFKVEKNRNKQIRSKIDVYKKQIRKNAFLDSDLSPVLKTYLRHLRQYITNSLPIQLEQRLSAVSDVEDRLNKKEIDAVKATNLFWALVEDEKRLTRENAISRQTIEIKNKKFLADVLKLGMMRMYFKIGGKSVGYAVKQPSGWVFKEAVNMEQTQQIQELFVSFKKQIRQGLFEVPL